MRRRMEILGFTSLANDWLPGLHKLLKDRKESLASPPETSQLALFA